MNSLALPPEIDGLRLRRVMGPDLYLVPRRYGSGWTMVRRGGTGSVIVTVGEWEDGHQWRHASIARQDHLPTYGELVQLHRAVFDGPSYQVFVAGEDHVNIHEYALHLWGRADGSSPLPNFGVHGSI